MFNVCLLKQDYVDCKLDMAFDELKKEFDDRRELGILRAMLVRLLAGYLH